MKKMKKASDERCCECGKPAVAYWPVIDPDIPAYPYCRECLDKAKKELMIKLTEIDEKYKTIKSMEVKILHLPLKAKWYDMQESGIKTEEYREITPYWYQRLYQRKKEFGYAGRLTRDDAEYCCDPGLRYILKGEGFADTELKPYTHVLFRYGYTNRCFIHRIDSITIGRGRPEWGAPTDRDVFIIKHHKEESPIIIRKEL